MTTRDEYLERAKRRALEYIDAGDVPQAFTSMLSDLRKHPDTENHAGGRIGVGLMMIPGWINNKQEVRRWIEGFR
jgi:hypothetical protein